MNRPAGKDTFDPKTYTEPATIKSMIELRAFCVDFFQYHVRDTTGPLDEKLLHRFINLITSSEAIFARARAVIPELQVRVSLGQSAQLDPNIRHVLRLIEHLPHPFGTECGPLVEHAAWSRFSRDGKELYDREAENKERADQGHGKPATDHDLPLRLEIPTHSGHQVADKTKEHSRQSSCLGPPSQSRQHFEGDIAIRAKPKPIATFVPREQRDSTKQLVWSPTSGTRELRPDEIREKPGHDKTNVTPYGANPPVTPVKETKTIIQHPDRAAVSIQRRPGKTINRPQLRGNNSTVQPFQQQLDQMLLGATTNPYLPSSSQWSPRSSAPPHRNDWAPSQPTHQQPYLRPSPTQLIESPPLILPAQGSLSLLEYWAVLYRRGQEITIGLSHSHRPILQREQDYLNDLLKARMETAALAILPPRGNLSARSWLMLLEEEVARMQDATWAESEEWIRRKGTGAVGGLERGRELEAAAEGGVTLTPAEQMDLQRCKDFEAVMLAAVEEARADVHSLSMGNESWGGRGRGKGDRSGNGRGGRGARGRGARGRGRGGWEERSWRE